MENFQYVRLLTFIFWIQRTTCQCPDTVHPEIKGFGAGCKYRCNCKDSVQCDEVTGECPNGCLFGWMGPGCQYRNLVTTSIGTEQHYRVQDEAHSAQKAIDGDVSICSSTGYNGRPGDPTQQWWRLELSTEFYIVGLVIRIRDSDKANFRGFSVEIGNTADNLEVCYQHGAGTDGEIVMNVNCVRPIIGKLVEIKLEENMPPPLVLCEVELFGGRLVSFNRLTSIQTVLTYSGRWNASYAVDGRPMLSSSENQNDESQRTCSATKHYISSGVKWWNVHLDTYYDIQGISFFGRLDSGTSQYKRYRILVGNDSSQTHLMFTDNRLGDKYAYNPKSRNFTRPFLSNAVRVERSADILVICELEVFAECPLGRCGWECNETCMCSSQTTGQPKIWGICPYGCSGRWSGHNGTCNIECSDTTWGPYCNQTCGQCKNNDLCSVSNGNCPDSCKPGFIPPLCLHECNDGNFGEDCNLTCGQCKHDAACNKENGRCVSGCKPGYKLPLCIQTCDQGWYGVNCSEQCGSCKKGEACNNTNGECTSGCSPGWFTSVCNKSCDIGFYGDGCSERCGYCLTSETCSNENGSCLHGCASGFHGIVCKTECSGNQWGPNCESTCGHCLNATCSKYTGSCPGECQSGWIPPHCIYAAQSNEQQGPSFTVGLIIGSVVAAVVFIALTLIISVIIIRKRRSMRMTDQNVSSNPDSRSGARNESEYNTLDHNRVDGNQEMYYSELRTYERVV